MRAPFATRRYNQRNLMMVVIDDDSSSVSSTVDISCASKEVPASTPSTIDTSPESRTTSRHRRVHFDVSQNVSYENRQPKRGNHSNNTWYTRSEYRSFKEYHRSKARQILQDDQENNNGNNGNDYYNSFPHAMERVFETCCFALQEQETLDHEDDQCFTQWISGKTTTTKTMTLQTHDRFGMERLSSRAINSDKFSRRRALWETVLDLQDDCTAAATATHDNKACMIAATCQDITRASRMFAMHLGRAQALAVV